MSFLDLVGRLGEPGVRRLLADAFGPSVAVVRAVKHYESGDWTVLGYQDQGEIVGFIGWEPLSPSIARIRGIAVDADRRGEGIGRRLVQETRTRNPGVALYAETDCDAVRFYRRCGFEVASLGELYPGVERFECSLPG